jgi:hypothetical protein
MSADEFLRWQAYDLVCANRRDVAEKANKR